MEQVSVVGLDLAKSVFQVHGVNAQGEAVLRRRLTRGQLLKLFEKLPPCLVGMEACASAHHWARELAALGHEVKLMPPQYVKPYVKRGKNDAADAEAICEAVMRACRQASTAGMARIADLLAASNVFENLDPAIDSADLGDRKASITARDDLWTMLVGGRSVSVQSGATAGVLATIGTTVISLAWFPPAAIVGVFVATVWGLVRGMKDTGVRQLEQARVELRLHLTSVMAELRGHFLDVSVDRDSRVNSFFSDLDAGLVRTIDTHAKRKLDQLDAEKIRLIADFELDDAGRSARIAEVKAQATQWDASLKRLADILSEARQAAGHSA